jgi:hypothetical protein
MKKHEAPEYEAALKKQTGQNRAITMEMAATSDYEKYGGL